MVPRRPTRPDHEARKRSALSRGVREFNGKLFYECHETLEEVWLEEPGDDVLFLQGLIQAAAAFHNARRGKWGGTERLLQAAMDKLSGYGDEHLGVDLAHLLDDLQGARRRALRLAARGGGPWRDAWDPRIRYAEISLENDPF